MYDLILSFNYHPPLTAFPVALITIVLFLEIVLFFKKSEVINKAVFVNLTIAVVTVIAAFFSGYHAESLYKEGLSADISPAFTAQRDAAYKVIELHQNLGRLLLFSFIACYCFFIAYFKASHNKTFFKVAYFLLLLCSFSLVVSVGYLGGEMVFKHDVGVSPGV